jgi:hypothetical protein
MAKKDKKSSKKKDAGNPTDVVDAVRGAVERTFQATAGQTEGARDRGRSLLDEVASAAQRIRESFDDLRVLEDVRGLRAEIQSLSERVAALEKSPAKPAAPAAAASKPAAAPKPAAAASKPAAAPKPAAAASKPAAAPKPAPPAKEPAAPKAAATKRAPARKPAASRSTTARKAPAKTTAAGTAASKTGTAAKPKPAAKPRTSTPRKPPASSGS